MLLGRVIGNVVATMKNASLVGQRLLIVQPVDRRGRDKGKPHHQAEEHPIDARKINVHFSLLIVR